MEPVERNSQHFRKMRILRMTQEIRVIAVVEEEDEDGDIAERQIVVDSINRPLPVPYNEEQ